MPQGIVTLMCGWLACRLFYLVIKIRSLKATYPKVVDGVVSSVLLQPLKVFTDLTFLYILKREYWL